MAKQTGKDWYRSKTYWAAIVTIVSGLGMYFTGEQSLMELSQAVVGAIFLALRKVTTDPIS